jgi:hypothetical protein
MLIRPGDLVQVDVESKALGFRCCPVFVEEINETEETITGYVIIPEKRTNSLMKITLSMDDVEYLTTPKWAPDICLKKRERI